jgi:hypothetical protein
LDSVYCHYEIDLIHEELFGLNNTCVALCSEDMSETLLINFGKIRLVDNHPPRTVSSRSAFSQEVVQIT